MPEDKPLENIEDSDESSGGDLQDIAIEQIEDEAKAILDAVDYEGDIFLGENKDDILSTMVPKKKGKAKDSSEASEEDDGSEGLGIRFNSIKEAEKETRKLQSERDKLEAKVKKLETGSVDPDIDNAKALIRDIQDDPKLAEGLTEYFKTGAFPGGKSDDESSYDDDEIYGSGNESGTYTEKEVSDIVEQKLNEKLSAVDQVNRQKAWVDAQKQALYEAYPHIDEDEWNELIDFAKDPQKVTLINLYKLKNINREIEDRAKVLAERYLRGKPQMRPSASSVGGSGRELEDEDPQVRAIKDIVQAGRRDSSLDF